MADRCPAPDADGRWCEYVGDGPCVRCGGDRASVKRPLLAELADSIDRARADRDSNRCRPCGRPCFNGRGVHDCCARQHNGRFCPACEASDRFWREEGERRARPRRRRSTTKKENTHVR